MELLRVVACVRPSDVARLRAATVGMLFEHCDTWSDARHRIARSSCDVSIAQLGARGLGPEQVVMALKAMPDVPVILYAAHLPHTAHVVLRAAAAGLRYLVLAGIDDAPAAFRRTILEAAEDGSFHQFVSRWAALGAQLPPTLTRATRVMFTQPHRFEAGRDLAAAAGVSYVGMYRSLAAAGFPSVRRLFIAARVHRWYRLASWTNESVERLARRVGYAQPRRLAEHIRLATGLAPREIRRADSIREIFEARLANWVLFGEYEIGFASAQKTGLCAT